MTRAGTDARVVPRSPGPWGRTFDAPEVALEWRRALQQSPEGWTPDQPRTLHDRRPPDGVAMD